MKKTKLIYSDVCCNNNKFWAGSIQNDTEVLLEWGRIGLGQQQKIKSFSSSAAAEKFLAKKINEKLNKGYTNLGLVHDDSVITVAPNLAEVAKLQIKSDTDTLKLIDQLSKANIHNILSSTSLEYQQDTGLFSTPLGIVTLETIQKARKVLEELSTFIVQKDFYSLPCCELFNQYLRLIPQKVGKRLCIESIFYTLEDITKQNDILDSLESSYQQVISKKELIKKELIETKTKEIPVIFKCEITVNEDPKVFDEISKMYYDSKFDKHSCAHLKPKRVYNVKIDEMSENFNKIGKLRGNIQTLWHGTKTANLLSIMKSGLIIPPSGDKNVTGRMFGDGVYFSDQSTKALNYSYGYWNSTRNDNCFMFLADVAMGKSYTPKSSRENLPKLGYDSTFAKGKQSGVYNNEMIVYTLEQINLKYLVEFSK